LLLEKRRRCSFQKENGVITIATDGSLCRNGFLSKRTLRFDGKHADILVFKDEKIADLKTMFYFISAEITACLRNRLHGFL
jgi:hypothetical protein